MSFTTIWNYYSREDVQNALLEIAKDKEVVSVYKDGSFGKRPNILMYPQDILQEVKQGAVAFHGSVERWSQPMKLTSTMLKEDMDYIRIGFDLLIDVDVKNFEIAKIATKEIIKSLEEHGIKNYSLKFTGGNSFHIGIPFESFPRKVNFQETHLLYPELPQKIIDYIKHYVKDPLRNRLLEVDTPFEIAKKLGKSIDDIVDENGIDPLKIIEIDPMLVSPRHLYRLPYSLHEKTLLVSLPIKPSEIDEFEKEYAKPEEIEVKTKFLNVKRNIPDSYDLVIEALDWVSRHKEEYVAIKPTRRKKRMREVSEKFFPPCIKIISNGLSDGRKRSVFVLITFLRSMGWNWKKIEDFMIRWNEKNRPPLRTNYIRTQMRWHIKQEKNIVPYNCDKLRGMDFFNSFSICRPETFCENIKNPINNPFKKLKSNYRRKRYH